MKKLNLTSVLFFLGPVIATIMGMISAHYFEVDMKFFIPNIAAIIVGIPMALLVAFKWKKRVKKELLVVGFVSIALLASCFLFPGVNMVHRWISFGSISINVSMIVLPLILFCIHQLLRQKFHTYAVVFLCLTGLLLSAQPDAGQTSAFGAAAILIFLINKGPWSIKGGALVIVSLFLFMAWNRVDLLETVDEAEDILSMIWDFGPIGYIGLGIVTLLVTFPFVFFAFKGSERALSLAFVAYFITQLVVSQIGNYPVPLLGAGASAVVGWYIMLGFASSKNNIHL